MRTAYPERLVYIGIRGTVVALDRMTGMEEWRTQLKGGEFVNVVLDGDSLIATARGEIYCLDPVTGRILWNNPLKGMGWGLITIAGANIAGSNIAPMAKRRMDEQSAAAAASSTSAAHS